MFVQFRRLLVGIAFVIVVVVFMFCLHALCQHFLVSVSGFCHGNQLCSAVLGGVQHVVDPCIRNAAYVTEHICPGDHGNVPYRGLIAVQVCAVFHQQCQVYVVHALCQLSCPVVFGKNGADNLQPVVCFRQRSAAAVQKKAPPEAEHQQKSQFSFHILSLPSVGIAAFEIENDFHIRIIT